MTQTRKLMMKLLSIYKEILKLAAGFKEQK